MNRSVKMLGGRLYSPILKDLAWLEDAQITFLIFFIHSSVNLAGLTRFAGKKLQTNERKIRKIN